MISNPAISILAPSLRRGEYPLAFWCLVFFTFIVFVAPQNLYTSLQPLHLARTSAILALGAYALQALAHQEPLLPRGPEVTLIGAFMVLAALSIPFSLWPGGSLETLTDLLAKSVIVCLLMVQLLTTLSRFKRLLWFTLLYGIIISAVAIERYQDGMLVEGYRTSGAFGGINANPNDLALTLNLIIPFALVFYGLKRGLLHKGFHGLFVVASVVAVILTYSRGGFITLAVVLALYSWKIMKQRRGLTFLLPVLLVVAAFFVLAPENYDERLYAITDFSRDVSGSAQARWTNILHAVEVMAEHPILGVGIGMNILALNAKGVYWGHVHNVYLQIASEIGVPALIVFVALLLRLLKATRWVQARYQGDQRRRELVLLAGATEISLMAFCVAAFFHPVAYHFYFYYIAGFALALKGIAARVPDEPQEQTVRTVRRAIGPGESWRERRARLWTSR